MEEDWQLIEALPHVIAFSVIVMVMSSFHKYFFSSCYTAGKHKDIGRAINICHSPSFPSIFSYFFYILI